jgi:hypothetical protein
MDESVRTRERGGRERKRGTFHMEGAQQLMGRVMIIIMITAGKSSKIRRWGPISVKALQPLSQND